MTDMKTIKWNFGIAIIRIGYIARKHQWKPKHFSVRWLVGVFILKLGYALRGEVPMRRWSRNHI